MLDLKGKKAFCFIALKHHGRYLFPLTRALEERGMEIIYPTATAESPFEITFIEEGMPYRHTLSYLDASMTRETEAAYRKLRSIWKEKLLQSSILHSFTLCIQDKALRMHVENFYLIRRMFEVERPDLVLALHEMNSWGKILGYLCHEFGVPYVTLQEGLYYGDTEFYRLNTEYSTGCLIWGQSTREVLLKAGGCDDKIFITGNTHLPNAIRQHRRPDAIRKAKKELDVRKNGRLVTLFMGGLGYHENFVFPDRLLSWLRANPELTLAVKWHPFNGKTTIQQISASLADFPNVRSLQQYNTYNLLAASDACALFGNSTTGLETLAFGKPLVEVRLDGQPYSYAQQGLAESAARLDDVPEAIEKIFRDGIPAERQAKAEAYLRYNLHSLDTKSVERTMAAIDRILSAGEARKSRVTAKPCAVSAADREYAFDCSVIVPFTSTEHVVETILNVANHTPAGTSYECILSTNLGPADVESLREIAEGDIRLVFSSASSIAALCNAAAREARGRAFCILPAGVIPQPDWLEVMMRAMDADEKIGVVGARIVYRNAILAHAGIAFDGNFSPTRLYRFLPGNFAGALRSRRIRAVADCFLARRACWEAAGGMDEAIESYLYDVDFC
ncbi:MAG: glycosyltransferase, partial [Candidatus Binatia bacterium]